MEITEVGEQKEKTKEKWTDPKGTFGTPLNGPSYASWGVSEEESEKRAERIFEEIMATHFLNLMKDININIQEAQLL